MAIGKASDFSVYTDYIRGGLVETLVQNAAIFNEHSAGALQLVPRERVGHYAYESFTKQIADGAISRRDITSTATADDTAITQGDLITVKLNRKIGPLAQTLDAFKKIGESPDAAALNYKAGAQIARGIIVDQIESALTAAKAAIVAQASTNVKDGSSATIATSVLVDALALMGDQYKDVIVWVMHSKPYFDLVKAQAFTEKIEGIANYNVQTGTPVTLNRPVIVVDCPALVVDNGEDPDTYMTLGLTPGAVRVEESEPRTLVHEMVTGIENISIRLQGEYAYNVGVRGCAWNVGDGGANPTTATLGTTTNWIKVASDAKRIAGVAIETL